MVKQVQIVAFAIIVIAVTAFNVSTVLDSNRSYDLNTTTIAAISGGEDGGDSGEGGNVDGEGGNVDGEGGDVGGEDGDVDGGEVPGWEIVCDTGGSGTCYQKMVEIHKNGYCDFDCEESGDTDHYCSSFWMGLLELCVNYL